MSRCFPYPPPGYERSVALIESIKNSGAVKLQKEREKSEKDRKKGKKSKSKSDGKKHESKKRHREDSTKSTHRKLKTDEDRSSVTEERGCPASAGVPLYDSSDVSQDSSKRILLTSVPTAEEQELKKTLNSSVSEPQGSKIKIRLRASEQPSTSEQPCFSGRTIHQQDPGFSGKRTKQETIQQQESGFSGRQSEETTAKEKKRKSKSSGKSSKDLHKQYKKLMRDWHPPSVELPEEDLSWLMSGTIASRRTLPLPLPSPPVAITAGDGPQCRARYAAEVGIYVLPYVVPF